MPRIGSAFVIALGLAFTGCSHPALFSKDVLRSVDENFDLTAWRSAPNASAGHTIKVGGKLVQADLMERGTLIVGMQLPIVEHPAYGPTEMGKRSDSFEFALLYSGKIDPGALSPGNRFIAVGLIQRTKVVEVDGAPKTEPYLLARCIHIWRTEGREIADFPNVGGGYYPLEEDTYCTKEP
ncbi:MAG TPA: Slp family lipoprotein [Nitrospiraceae bacterium]|nr:Slp family lipoprotein [Nitrospiraceae bacterium]